MAKTATREIHRDSEPLFTGTHKGISATTAILTDSEGSLIKDSDGEYITDSNYPNFTSVIRDKGACFRSLGIDPDLGLYCENETQGTGGYVTAADEDTVTVSGVTWEYGDTYSIYKTATKDSFISSVWCDVSRGFKINHPDEINKYGWRREDWDIDDRGRKDVFGPGQPEV
jgi:hypothetical protein